jgi:hypothetical protein
MDKEELRDLYEAFGDESVYAEAMRRYEDAPAIPWNRRDFLLDGME